MSHFTVLVIGPETEEELAAAMLPFHEFECTGTEAYIQDIDRTEEALAEYASTTYVSRNDAPCETKPPFAEFVQEYYGAKVVPFGRLPDVTDTHKYGYALTDENGNVTKVVRRTNPNKQWDWYVVGGRWSNMFSLLPGRRTVIDSNGTTDSARICDIDFAGMVARMSDEITKRWTKWTNATKDHPPFESWESVRNRTTDLGDAREFYNTQPAVKALSNAGFWSAPSQAEFIGVTLEQAVSKAKERIIYPFAILKIEDGTPKWYERGSMGWWGVVSDEKSAEAWQQQVCALLEGLPTHTVLTNVDCHI